MAVQIQNISIIPESSVGKLLFKMCYQWKSCQSFNRCFNSNSFSITQTSLISPFPWVTFRGQGYFPATVLSRGGRGIFSTCLFFSLLSKTVDARDLGYTDGHTPALGIAATLHPQPGPLTVNLSTLIGLGIASVTQCGQTSQSGKVNVVTSESIVTRSCFCPFLHWPMQGKPSPIEHSICICMLMSAAVTRQGSWGPSTPLAALVDTYPLLSQILRGALCQQWPLEECHCPLRTRKSGGGLPGLSLYTRY